ncbi:hypothetical protein E2C01_099640 [Portunus trituberculatus]|uniref:Uncharacterized protein n=1 Tax=Portunus trituberculatus TaxID=210409 RepID=A0A5B7KFF5_PORTR|nr:hypothetical protein [Portunus trituberculatus]
MLPRLHSIPSNTSAITTTITTTTTTVTTTITTITTSYTSQDCSYEFTTVTPSLAVSFPLSVDATPGHYNC